MDSFEFKICKIPKNEKLKTSKYNIRYSHFQCQPRFNYGFHHYIHTAKDKCEIFNDPKYCANKIGHTNKAYINIDVFLALKTGQFLLINFSGIQPPPILPTTDKV